MTTETLIWTDSAAAALEHYFQQRLAADQLDGADPTELRADLHSHLHEELLTRRITTVTVDELCQALARMGETLPSATVPSVHSLKHPPPPQSTGYFWIKTAGLIFPLFVFLFEICTRGCAGMLFDPMPDLVHHGLVFLVPLTTWVFLRSRRAGAGSFLRTATPWLAGAGLASALYYFLCFIPVYPIAIPGLILFGIGLLPFSAFFALTALIRVNNRLVQNGDGTERLRIRIGFWGLLAFLLLLEIPTLITRIGIHRSHLAGNDPTAWASATRLVRDFGSEKALLAACYDGNFRNEFNTVSSDPISWLAGFFSITGSGATSSMDESQTVSRDLYYRVTGQFFNRAIPPRQFPPLIDSIFGNGRSNFFDPNRGGTEVAGVIEALSLSEGRMDWHCEQATGLTWGEWTLTFSNSSNAPQEARCRIALPPGGFVSRVTLWVNGQPEEAAYNSVSKVRAAYQSVAVVQRRDPVLVTQPDASSIFLQAFPVPAHGQLKTRLTFTVPASAEDRIWLPSIVEQNFKISPATSHSLWVQADHGTLTTPEDLPSQRTLEAGSPTLTASLAPRQFTGVGLSLHWTHQRQPLTYCEDPFAPPAARLLLREETPPSHFKPGAIAWVIDTSAPLAPFAEALTATLRATSWPEHHCLFLPGDAPSELQIVPLPAPFSLQCEGGRDNGPALTAAIQWLRSQPDACLIWIHGPQTIGTLAKAPLEQLLERSLSPFTLIDLPLAPGTNSYSQMFSGQSRIQSIPARHDGADLTATLQSAFLQRSGKFTTLPADTTPPPDARRVGDTLARWYARTEASRLGLTDLVAASSLAASHQIVSPWSGAVVLERATDYDKFGLKQSESSTSQKIPTVPEPSGTLLIFITASHFLLRRRRKHSV